MKHVINWIRSRLSPYRHVETFAAARAALRVTQESL